MSSDLLADLTCLDTDQALAAGLLLEPGESVDWGWRLKFDGWGGMTCLPAYTELGRVQNVLPTSTNTCLISSDMHTY